jgi:hypothetical protein
MNAIRTRKLCHAGMQQKMRSAMLNLKNDRSNQATGPATPRSRSTHSGHALPMPLEATCVLWNSRLEVTAIIVASAAQQWYTECTKVRLPWKPLSGSDACCGSHVTFPAMLQVPRTNTAGVPLLPRCASTLLRMPVQASCVSTAPHHHRLTLRQHPCTEVLSRCSNEAALTPSHFRSSRCLRLASRARGSRLSGSRVQYLKHGSGQA